MNPEFEKDFVERHMQGQRHSSVYLVTAEWWALWDRYTAGASARPEALNNHTLLQGHSLRKDLGEAEYKTLNETV